MQQQSKTRWNARYLAVTAIMAAIATVLMMLSFSIPLVPSFLKLDFSEFPALIAAFALGPVSGAAVCFLKNFINVFSSSTGGAGELCNFLMGLTFVVPAGLIYRKKKTLKGAVIASLLGALIMAVCSVPLNYFISYPAYAAFFGMTTDKVMALYQAILPSVKTLPQALIVFNAPFTLFKGLCDVLLTFLIYKRISPILKGVKK